MEKLKQRKIIHIDMDAFFASVEQLDNPELKGMPVAVGGKGNRGVVAAASYEARKYGVFSAMSSIRALKQCPHLIFVKPRFKRYNEISNQIRSIFFEYTDLVEPLSLDEAYLDVTTAKKGPASATLIAKEIKERIKRETKLIASAGISFNKFLAKTASDMDKPDGLFIILPEDADSFINKLPIKKFHGIGSVTAEKMKKAGIFMGEDLKKKSLSDLTLRFGKAGGYYYNICRGIDTREVVPDRERKSISAENTFNNDLMKVDEVIENIIPITQEVYKRYKHHNSLGKTITIKVKYGDFSQITRSKTFEQPIKNKAEFVSLVQSFILPEIIRPEGIRLLGVGISNFEKEKILDQQLTIAF